MDPLEHRSGQAGGVRPEWGGPGDWPAEGRVVSDPLLFWNSPAGRMASLRGFAADGAVVGASWIDFDEPAFNPEMLGLSDQRILTWVGSWELSL